MALDQLQHVLGIEARLEHDLAAAAERQHAVGVRRRMIHRPVHQDDLILVRLDAIGDAADPRRGRDLFRRHRLAAHALGQAGGARRVEHRRAADRRLLEGTCVSRQRSQSVMPSGTWAGAGAMPNARRDFRRGRHHQQLDMAGQAVPDLRQQVGMADQDIGAAVGQDVGDFLGLQVPVDRHHRTAQRGGAAGDLEQRKVVAQHHADGRAAADAEGGIPSLPARCGRGFRDS